MHAVERSRTWAAARYLAGKAAEARMQAVRRSRYVALRFEANGQGYAFSVAVDGNRNGVRTEDIESGTDAILEPPARLPDLFPGVVIALDGGEEAVRFGMSGLLSFSPFGTSSSGTVYIRGRDGSQFAVRVAGTTGRTRVLQYRRASRDWVEVF